VNRCLSRTRSSQSGNSLIEFALILPFLVMIIINVVNFGTFFYAWISVSNAVRAGADYMIMGAATVGAPAAPSAEAVRLLVKDDLQGLPNATTAGYLKVRVCKNNNNLVLTDQGDSGTATLAADVEAPYYVSAMVEVTYTYTPVLPVFGLPLTIGTTPIHRTAMMRMEG
jgi:Flp pilus assembly protein TadG